MNLTGTSTNPFSGYGCFNFQALMSETSEHSDFEQAATTCPLRNNSLAFILLQIEVLQIIIPI